MKSDDQTVGPPRPVTEVVSCRVTATARRVVEKYAQSRDCTMAEVLIMALELHLPGFAEANT